MHMIYQLILTLLTSYTITSWSDTLTPPPLAMELRLYVALISVLALCLVVGLYHFTSANVAILSTYGLLAGAATVCMLFITHSWGLIGFHLAAEGWKGLAYPLFWLLACQYVPLGRAIKHFPIFIAIALFFTMFGPRIPFVLPPISGPFLAFALVGYTYWILRDEKVRDMEGSLFSVNSLLVFGLFISIMKELPQIPLKVSANTLFSDSQGRYQFMQWVMNFKVFVGLLAIPVFLYTIKMLKQNFFHAWKKIGYVTAAFSGLALFLSLAYFSVPSRQSLMIRTVTDVCFIPLAAQMLTMLLLFTFLWIEPRLRFYVQAVVLIFVFAIGRGLLPEILRVLVLIGFPIPVACYGIMALTIAGWFYMLNRLTKKEVFH